jgi:Zn-dependent metalloprotease
MKNKIALLLALLPLSLQAQQSPNISNSKAIQEDNSLYSSENVVRFKAGQGPSALKQASAAEQLKELLVLPADYSVNFLQKYDDFFKAGVEHYSFQEYYQGIPILYSIVKVQQNASEIISVTGKFTTAEKPINKVNISPEAALAQAKNAVPAVSYKWERKEEEAMLREALQKPNFSYDPKTHLVLYPTKVDGKEVYRYAYALDIYSHEPDARYNVYIDAENGSVLAKIPTMCTIDVKGIAVTKYHGTQEIMTDSLAPNSFRLKETNRKGLNQVIETRDCNTGDEGGSVDFIDSDNIWNNKNSQYNEASTDCHFGAEMTFDYFYDSLGRDSYDNQGSPLLQYVHFDVNWFNAQWTGSYSRYGDGNGAPLTSVDVVSHEITHGITQETAGLIYAGESGALNESFSDIFGTVVEFKKLDSTASWEIGTSSFKLRDMAAPNRYNNPDCYEGLFFTKTVGCVPSGNNDYCGVHNNSGIQNFWFYLLSQGGTGRNDIGNDYAVVGVGLDRAARIAYKNLRDYLGPDSDFQGARDGSIQAAIDLYGFNSPECQAVMNAWHAVGVGQPYSVIPQANFGIKTPVCQPNQALTFVNTSGSALTYMWDFGDGAVSTLSNPSHAYAAVGNYSVRLIAFNPNGSDTILKTNFVSIVNDAPKPSTCAPTTAVTPGTTGIYRVQFANIDNASPGPIVEGAYMDYTCSRALVASGGSYPIEITTFTAAPVFTRVYVDWNNNGGYDVTELVMATNNTLTNHYDTISIPLNAVKDVPLRMRIYSAKPATNTPDVLCSTLRNGQIEDYSVEISSALGFEGGKKEKGFVVYPNPSTGIIQVQNAVAGMSYRLLDLQGRVILEGDLQGSIIDLQAAAKGVYLLELQSTQGLQYSKVVLEGR